MKELILRGQIYYVDFYDMDSHVIRGKRPAVIVSNDMHNKNSGTVIVVPITTTIKDYPTSIDIHLDSGIHGQINCADIMTVDKRQLVDYKDQIPDSLMQELDRTLSLELQIGGRESFSYILQQKKVERAKKAYEEELRKLNSYKEGEVT